jgi:deazaflavin-dependent oxidoreductase (nitroreductase family)
MDYDGRTPPGSTANPHTTLPYLEAMPSDLSLKAMNAVHRILLTVTRGRAGWNVNGMAALELTTIGRKTGQPRPLLLTSPLQDGETIVVVASRGGDPQHPAWYLNILDNPAVEVSFQGAPKRPMHARPASREERARLWPLVIKDHPHYGGYQQRTDREIPLVLLEPVPQ